MPVAASNKIDTLGVDSMKTDFLDQNAYLMDLFCINVFFIYIFII
jgi:hypothetical protein